MDITTVDLFPILDEYRMHYIAEHLNNDSTYDDYLKPLQEKLVTYIENHNDTVEHVLNYLESETVYYTEFFNSVKKKFYNTKFLDMCVNEVIANEGRKLYTAWDKIEKIETLINALKYGKTEKIS